MPRKKRKKQVEGVGGLWSMRRVGRRYVSECELSTEMVVNVSTCCTIKTQSIKCREADREWKQGP